MATKKQQKDLVSNSLAAGAGGVAASFVNGMAQDFLPADFAQFNGAIPVAVGAFMQLQKSKSVQSAGLGMTAVGIASLIGQTLQGLEVGSPAMRVERSQVR